MEIGEVIRQYRKKKGLTQEELANRLGVTAPAVNKWEKGHSHPDILLLAPIARLLDISLDTLFSFEKELTVTEINQIIHEMDHKLKNQPFEDVFRWAKEILAAYPNCEQLIGQVALLLDVHLLEQAIPAKETYEKYIYRWYEQALESRDEDTRNRAADSLFGFYVRKEAYEKAESYLHYFSNQNPERKSKQAYLYSKTGRVAEAYQAYEELLFSGYQRMSMVFQQLYLLAMSDENKAKAHLLVKKQSELAQLFEMGEYHEISSDLDLAIAEKEADRTIEAMEKILASVAKITDFTHSTLYEHMTFKEIDSTFVQETQENFLRMFSDEETFSWLKTNERWQVLVGKKS
ncbi:helix-turn-helix transcriptional regulator [Enterococcus sp.]|uniref:helix-turn-helix domain-containing protein n=1 Tax=Enterococcus sp. TaxID=35783 RepID=UPI0025BE91E3|nr:helix-turn-helix transcriptional regulator [Enterococcus sp.]